VTLAVVVGDVLKNMRLRARLSQAEVALRMGTYRPCVCRLERGIHDPQLQSILAYVQACGGCICEVTRAIDRELGLEPPSARAA
jgi:predicted transcriptional regulator